MTGNGKFACTIYRNDGHQAILIVLTASERLLVVLF
jgi:hypothetical protein